VSAEAGASGDDRAKRFVLIATILGSSLAFIDGTVVSIALPSIQSELAGSVEGAQWVVNAYTLMLGALVLVGGAAGDRFGRRRIFLLGIFLFTLASLACGLAPSSAFLVAARAVQGIGAALLVPSSLALITATFPRAERGRAIGSWAGFSALTTAFGPILGGAFVDALSWRAIFFLNLPIALATFALTYARVPESHAEADEPAIDWLGGALAVIGLSGIAYGLTSAATLGWRNGFVVGALLAGFLILAGFIVREARTAAPMLPLGLFRARHFAGGNVVTLLLYFALGGTLFLLPFDLIRVQGYSATEAGAAFLPFTALMCGLSRWSGGLVARIGARLPLTVGPLIAAAGNGWLALHGAGGSYWLAVLPAMLLLGLGMAIAVAPLTTVVMDSVDERHAGAASGTNNAVARIAGMLAVALLGALAVGVFAGDLDRRLTGLAVTPEIRREIAAEVPKLAEAEVPRSVQGAERQLLERALQDSFLASYRLAMLVAAAMAALSGVAGLLMIRA